MCGFTLDTSGVVADASPSPPRVNGEPCSYRWENLTPFQQGYVEAALSEYAVRKAWRLRHGGPNDIPPAVPFRHLAPETLALVLKDCERRDHEDFVNINGSTDVRAEGRWFWTARQRGSLETFPPLTVTPGDDGKVYLRGAIR